VTPPTRPEVLEALAPAGARRSPAGAADVTEAPRSGYSRRWRYMAALAAGWSLLSATSALGGREQTSSRPNVPPTVCSTIGDGPSACVTVDKRMVVATLRNDLNVEVCGDFRLTLLRDDGHDQRYEDPNELLRSGCMPASDHWDLPLPLSRPGLTTPRRSLRPYRFMCVTGYRLRYGRWAETGWACRHST